MASWLIRGGLARAAFSEAALDLVRDGLNCRKRAADGRRRVANGATDDQVVGTVADRFVGGCRGFLVLCPGPLGTDSGDDA